MNKKALITGVNGQDGSYLSEYLLCLGYDVYGLIRRDSNYDSPNIREIKNKIHLVYGDLATDGHISSIINDIKPDELYNLAAQSDVGISFEIPEYTADISGLGVLRILESIRKFSPKTKMYQASTSEMFGSTPAPQNENSIMQPNNPYAAAKLMAHNLCRIYRKSYDLYISCGILFNHESPRRGLNFVTRKICSNVAKIYRGEIEYFELGNLDAKRDWGYAPEYTEVMHLILQQEKPDDFVIGTGEQHTIREFLDEAFGYINIKDWSKYIKINKNNIRPLETQNLCSDISKAKNVLDWEPKVKFKDLVRIMMESELKL